MARIVEDATPRKPKLRVRVEDVQLCIANAERLLADSEEVSEPTAVALAELALEEALKGWVLVEHRTDRKRDASQLESTAPKAVQEYLKSNVRLLKKIDPREVFERHWPKLDALRFVAGFLRVSLEATSADQLSQMVRRTSSDGTTMAGFVDEGARNQMLRLLTVVNEVEARRLSELKERGLYVNLSDRDQIVSPDSVLFPNSKVFILYVRSILGLLKGAVTATVKP